MSFPVSFVFITIALISIELLYFKIADRFNIIDKPNHRSSHTHVTIRGGGVIFTVAGLLFYFYFGFQYPFFIVGLLSIAIISFVDDVVTLNNKIRLSVHFLSVILMFFQWQLFELDWYWFLIATISVIGTINAYNFMDGINGITGGYSLLVFITLYYINEQVVSFTSSDLLVTIGLSLVVFNFFNFRTKAKCFAGDIGSISIAFIVVFLLGQLIITTQNFSYILLLLVYGLDAVTTIFFRVIRKENIFEAHRSHLYQFLANNKKWPQLLVVITYLIFQLIINALTIYLANHNPFLVIAIFLIGGLVFLSIRFKIEGKARLLKAEDSYLTD